MNVTDWLLDSDPAIRWQVMRDLTDAPDEEVAAERAKVAREGWGAAVLAAQRRRRLLGRRSVRARVDVDDVQPPAAAPVRRRPDRGIGAASARPGPRQREVGVRRPALLRRRGRAVHQRPGRRDRRLLRPGRARHRRPPPDRADGRWRLELRAGAEEAARRAGRSTRRSTSSRDCSNSSERPAANAEVAAARERGEEYLLERRLLRRLSDGEIGESQVAALRVPDRVALRRPARPRLPPRCRRRAGRADRPRRSSSSSRSATPTGGGRSASSSTTSCRWTSASARESRAAGSRCGPCGSCAGPGDRRRHSARAPRRHDRRHHGRAGQRGLVGGPPGGLRHPRRCRVLPMPALQARAEGVLRELPRGGARLPAP